MDTIYLKNSQEFLTDLSRKFVKKIDKYHKKGEYRTCRDHYMMNLFMEECLWQRMEP